MRRSTADTSEPSALICAWFVFSASEKRDTILQIRVKIKDIMMKAKDINDISTQYVRN